MRSPTKLHTQLQAAQTDHLQNYTLSLEAGHRHRHRVQQVRSSAVTVARSRSRLHSPGGPQAPASSRTFLPTLYPRTPPQASSPYLFTCHCARCAPSLPGHSASESRTLPHLSLRRQRQPRGQHAKTLSKSASEETMKRQEGDFPNEVLEVWK